MKEAVEKIVKAIVAEPDAVEISEIADGKNVKIRSPRRRRRYGQSHRARRQNRESDSQYFILRRTKTEQTVSTRSCRIKLSESFQIVRKVDGKLFYFTTSTNYLQTYCKLSKLLANFLEELVAIAKIAKPHGIRGEVSADF